MADFQGYHRYMSLFLLLRLCVPPSSLPYMASIVRPGLSGRCRLQYGSLPVSSISIIQSSIGQIEVWITPLPPDLNPLFPIRSASFLSPLGHLFRQVLASPTWVSLKNRKSPFDASFIPSNGLGVRTLFLANVSYIHFLSFRQFLHSCLKFITLGFFADLHYRYPYDLSHIIFVSCQLVAQS